MILIDDIAYIYNNEMVPVCTKIDNDYSNGNFPAEDDLISLTKILNKIIVTDNGEPICCSNVCFTKNTDKMLFGIKVDPTITDAEIVTILLDQDGVTQFKRYELEIDSKLLDQGITGEQLAAYIVEEVYSIMSSEAIVDVKNAIAEYIANKDGDICLRNSINYSQIIIFAFKQLLNNFASFLHKDDDAVGMLKMPNMLNIKDSLKECRETLCLSLYGFVDPESAPNLGTLEWAFMIYDDIKLNIRMARRNLMDAQAFTGSALELKVIDFTLKSIERAFNEVLSEAAKIEDNYLSELSLFKSLKNQGLKSIEADLYEYKLQAKNCVEQEEALFIIRQINTRIGIIEDYLANEDLSDSEKNKWTAIDMEYRELRQELAKKKLSMRKNVGYFVDYDKLDQYD